ncbi:MAG: NAD-dependent protein deacylase [Anaerotardibacter sp.]
MRNANQDELLKEFQELIAHASAQSIVFFGGAGVSTESGIPDFRSAKGIFNQAYPYPPEVIVSHTFFEEHPKEFFEFYRAKFIHLDAKPNKAHLKLAQLEEEGKLISVVTQNVDGLHQKGGCKKVRELHGSVYRNYCLKCGKRYDITPVLEADKKAKEGKGDGIPRCSCSGMVRPEVVLYEEGLDEATMVEALTDIQKAKILIIAGTSLNVYPAAGLINAFRGEKVVVINLEPSAQDMRIADICLPYKVGEVFGSL